MKTSVQEYIDKMLENTQYEYDESVKAWAGSVSGMWGIYAKGTSVEEVRREL